MHRMGRGEAFIGWTIPMPYFEEKVTECV